MRGAELEKMVRHSAERQRDRGLWLVQTGPRFVGRRTGPRGQAEGRIVGVGALDFIGDLRGRAVTFDCKSSRHGSRFDLDLIAEHQAVILKRAHARGAIAFLLVELGADGPAPAYYALTWPTLYPWWEGFMRLRYSPGKYPASIPVDVLARECVAVKRDRKTFDLVAAIEVMAAKVMSTLEGGTDGAA